MSLRRIALWSCRSSGFVGKAIQTQTWSDVNHSAFEWVDNALFIDIGPPKLRLLSVPSILASGKGDVIHRFYFDVPEKLYLDSLQFAREHMVGKKYDYVSVARFLLPVRALVGRLKPTQRAMTNSFFCSEGTEILFRKCDLPLVNRRRLTAKVSPQDQYESVRLYDAVSCERWEAGQLVYLGAIPEDF